MINEYGSTEPITDTAYTGTASNDDVISTLNGLIETCKDGQEGYKESAEGIERSDLKSLFYEFSQQRAQFLGELQSLVRELGGDPETSGSFSGALHRGWINIKAAVTGQDEHAVLNECERGEDAAKAAYKSATETNLPSNVAQTIQNQYSSILAAHDRIKALRDSTGQETSTSATSGF
jgi:uncharacterized protein (TIGR02284 family)